MALSVLTFALPLFSTAHAGVELYVSDAVASQSEIVARVVSMDTTCETFVIDERANRTATYHTVVSVEEVLSWPAETTAAPLVSGESLTIQWTAFTPGVDGDTDDLECSTPEISLSTNDVRTFVLLPGDDVWSVDTIYVEDVGEATEGDGELPDCGEDEQQAVAGSLEDDPAGDTGMGGDTGEVLLEDGTGEAGGCSTVPGSPAGLLTALIGLVGLARRRNHSNV